MERRGYEISEKHTKDILQRLVAGAPLGNLEGAQAFVIGRMR